MELKLTYGYNRILPVGRNLDYAFSSYRNFDGAQHNKHHLFIIYPRFYVLPSLNSYYLKPYFISVYMLCIFVCFRGIFKSRFENTLHGIDIDISKKPRWLNFKRINKARFFLSGKNFLNKL